MNDKQKAGLVIYQNAAQTDRSFWFFVEPNLFDKVTHICEKTFLDRDMSDKEIWETIWNLLYDYENHGYHPDIIYQSHTDPWGRHGERNIPLNKYEIVGIIPIKQVF